MIKISTREGEKSYLTGPWTIMVLPAVFTSIALLLTLIYRLSFIDTLVWYAGVFIFFFIPGNLLKRSLSFKNEDHFVGVFHSIALGAALMPIIYILARKISYPGLLPAAGIAMAVVWSIMVIRNFRSIVHVRLSYSDIVSILFLLVTGFLLLHLSYFTDVVFHNGGISFRNIYFTETDFHLGLVNMLKSAQTPIYPYASGVGLSFYHMNMHLQIEMFNRFFSLDTISLTFFYFPLLYFYLLMVLPYSFIRTYNTTGMIAVLAGVSMFAADFSFLPGLLGIYPPDYPWADVLAYPWTLFFKTTIWSIFCMNGILPSVFTMSLCMMYFRRFFDTGNAAVLAVFFVLAYASFGYKSSMGVHIAGTALLTGIVLMSMRNTYKGILLSSLSIITLMIMAGDILFVRGEIGNNIVQFDLLNGFKRSLSNVRLSGSPALLYPVLLVLYLLFTFGVRSLGIGLLKDVIAKKNNDPVVVFLLLFSISGVIVSELLYIGDPFYIENNAVWFSVQALFGASLLLFIYLGQMKDGRKRLFTLIAVVFLSFPTTLQFLKLRFDNNYHLVSSQAMEVVRYLEKTPADAVILHPNNNGGLSLASNLTGRWSVFSPLHSHVTEHIGPIEAANRAMAVDLFFDSNTDIDRSAILRKYQVDYVYAPLEHSIFLNKEPMLKNIFMNREYAIYQRDDNENGL